MGSKTFKLILAIAILILVALAVLRSTRVGPVRVVTVPPTPAAGATQPSLTLPSIVVGQTVYLSDLPWASASTGWLAIANDGLPAKDFSFPGRPITLRGVTYRKGIGTYPVSEIVYRLDGDYTVFESDVGLDDAVPVQLGGVEFLVFVDDVLVYRSGILRGGDPVARVRLGVESAQELRLVVADVAEGAALNYADWADARLVRPLFGGGASDEASVVPGLDRQRQDRKEARVQDTLRSHSLALAEIASLKASTTVPSPSTEAIDHTQTALVFDEQAGRLWLRNNYLAIGVGYGRGHNADLTVLYLPTQSVIIYRAIPEVTLASGEQVSWTKDTRAEGFRFTGDSRSGLGSGKSLEARYAVPESGEELTVKLTLYDDSPYFLYDLHADGFAARAEPVEFHYFSFDADSFNLGEDVAYLTDHSRLRRGIVRDDGVVRRDVLGYGKPLLLWGISRSQALLMAAIDESRTPTYLKTKMDPGHVMGRVGLIAGKANAGGTGGAISSPRLYVEGTDSSDPSQAFKNFKRTMTDLYPPAPLPSWVKYQWLSWYTYYMDIGEEAVRRQIDYIAANLADLGPWSVLVDAGWYVSEGREGSDWRNVDEAKFPSGLRALVDYAHARGVRVVLYFSAPYLDSRERGGDWLGLRGIIEKHPDWLELLGEDESRKSFVYDFTNPDLLDYMRSVLEDYFVKYDVDGIKVDGLGNAEGAILDTRKLDSFGLVDSVSGPAMDIYRFIHQTATQLKPEAYVESGWLTPVFANRYAHTFRYGDEYNTFTNPYPFPGLVEHVDYAAFQKMALGQRPNMGAITGDPGLSIVNQWWLAAGLALGTQVVLSFDLPSLSPEALSEYRSLLMHYDAFAGETRLGSASSPDSFATAVGDITYLGIFNREAGEKTVTLRLSDYGLNGEGHFAVYDVGRSRFVRSRGSIFVNMPGETFRLFIVRKSPGLMWTNSSIHDANQAASSLEFTAMGPASIGGSAKLYTPEPKSVSVDGRQLPLSLIAEADEDNYWYNRRTGILTVRYGHDAARRIRITYLSSSR